MSSCGRDKKGLLSLPFLTRTLIPLWRLYLHDLIYNLITFQGLTSKCHHTSAYELWEWCFSIQSIKTNYCGIPEKRNTFKHVLIHQLNVLVIQGGLWVHSEWPYNPHKKNKMNKCNRPYTVWTVQGIRIIWYVMSYLCMGKSTGGFHERDPSLW